MLKNLIIVSIFVLAFTIQPAQSSPVGAIDKLDGEWNIQQQGQDPRILTPKHHKLKWMPVFSGDQYTLKSEKGCLHYWLMEKRNVNFHSSCPKKNEGVKIPAQKSAHYNLASLEVSLGTQRDDVQQPLNINNHLPAKTAIAGNTLHISWAEFEPEQPLKAIFLDDQPVSLTSEIRNKISLPVKEKAGWQKWRVILNNGHQYSGQVKKLSSSEFSEINQTIQSLEVNEEYDPKGRALSRAFIFLENQLYLNAWQVFYTLYKQDKSTGINQLMLATEQAMGLATKTLKVEH